MNHTGKPGDQAGSTPCEYISWEQFHGLARTLALQVRNSGFQPDMIVAIARGGYLPARILSDYLDILDLTSIKVEHYHGMHKERLATVRYPLSADIDGKRLLLVDDVSDSGDTFEATMGHLQSRGTPKALMTAVLHHKRTSSFVPDYFAEEVLDWRWIIYPWAVIEDLTSLLQKMKPCPDSVAAFDRQLRQRHGVAFPLQTLEDVLTPSGSFSY
jgi:hypoxanthine phosphoribosyltransferase